MTPARRKSGNRHLHRKTTAYRDGVRRKLAACHRHIQLGIVAQGLLQILSATSSELVTAIALSNTLTEFIADNQNKPNPTKFLIERIDLQRTEGIRLIAC